MWSRTVEVVVLVAVGSELWLVIFCGFGGGGGGGGRGAWLDTFLVSPHAWHIIAVVVVVIVVVVIAVMVGLWPRSTSTLLWR